jgi:5-methylcytosine-specific restriction endonuclease McrA
MGGQVTRALVLNASNEPLSVVPARRAVVLVLHERASMVEVGDGVWHAETVVVQVPSVVRLLSYVHVPFNRRAALTRNAVFARDDHRCQYCHGPADSVDHVVPRSRGGVHSWDNVVACCRRCNLRKGDRSPAEAGLALHRPPASPRRYGWIYASAGHRVDPRWHPYLAETA